jgi:hypothetical protein
VKLSDDPPFRLPEDLQSKRRALLEQKEKIEEELKVIKGQICERRKTCSHEATPGTLDHYATYCHKCGHMMDTWL